jgi:hypothetical protein
MEKICSSCQERCATRKSSSPNQAASDSAILFWIKFCDQATTIANICRWDETFSRPTSEEVQTSICCWVWKPWGWFAGLTIQFHWKWFWKHIFPCEVHRPSNLCSWMTTSPSNSKSSQFLTLDMWNGDWQDYVCSKINCRQCADNVQTN